MTKQAFDQIAEGLREATDTPPEWALTRARGIVAKDALPIFGSSVEGPILAGKMDDDFSVIKPIARALTAVEAETAERVEAETIERCARVARDGWLVPPDGGSPTEAEKIMCDGIAVVISYLPAKYGKAKT